MWHLRPHCLSNCQRASDHVLLQSNEKEALHKWCQKTFLEWGGQQQRSHPCAPVPAPPHAVSAPTTTATPFAPAVAPLSVERPTAEQKPRHTKHPEMVPADNESGEPHVSSLNPSAKPCAPHPRACSLAHACSLAPKTDACSPAQPPACSSAPVHIAAEAPFVAPTPATTHATHQHCQRPARRPHNELDHLMA